MSQSLVAGILKASVVAGFACLLSCNKADDFISRKPQAELRATDKRFNAPIVQLQSDTVYIIATDLLIRRGQTLVVSPGTVVKVNNGVALRVQPGGKLEAAGTVERPVVFTSAASSGSQNVVQNSITANSWRGIELEGEPAQSSGTLRYVRIEFAGNRSNAGLYLRNVDSLTTINHVQVSFTFSTPGFLFSGGNCQAKYLYSYCNAASDFDFAGGYRGKLQFIVAHRHPLLPLDIIGNNLAGLLIRDQGTVPAISNASVIGPDNQPGTTAFYADTSISGVRNRKSALVVFNNAAFRVANSSFAGFPQAGLFLDGQQAAANLSSGQSLVVTSAFHSNNASRVFVLPSDVFPGIGSSELRALVLATQFGNAVYAGTSELVIQRPYDFDGPDLLPASGSPLLNGSRFSDFPFNDSFFEKVQFKGAFGTGNWLGEWVNFTPLRTNYNN